MNTEQPTWYEVRSVFQTERPDWTEVSEMFQMNQEVLQHLQTKTEETIIISFHQTVHRENWVVPNHAIPLCNGAVKTHHPGCVCVCVSQDGTVNDFFLTKFSTGDGL